MPKVNEQELVERFGRGIQNGSANYQQGVTGAGNKWKDRAASDEAEARYRRGVERAAQQKLRQKQVQAVNAGDWETAAREIGARNYAASAEKARTNYAKVAADVVAAAGAAEQAAAAIAGETMEQRLQRGPAAARAIHRHWARKKGVQPEV